MSEPTPREGLSSLTEAFKEALSSPQPDYETIRYLLEQATMQEMTAPVRLRILQTLAATYARLGDWPSACSTARNAYEEVAGRQPLDVDMLIEATHTYTTILDGAGKYATVGNVIRAALDLALPHATPPQLAQLVEMRATLTASRIRPSND